MPAPTRQAVIDAALGRRPATLIIREAQIVDVLTREIINGDVAMLGDRIIGVGDLPERVAGPDTELEQASRAYLIPGFIEPHLHAGEPSLSPTDLARALLERGTTTLATDLVEFYALGGPPAVSWALSELEEAGLRTLFLLPLHLLGAERLGTLRHEPSVEDFVEMGSWPQTVGVNEPPPAAVLDGDGGVVQVLDAILEQGGVFQGHAPGLGGKHLQAYLAAGATSDHESTSAEEALRKLRLGCWIMMRECAASRDLRRLVPLLLRYPEAARFCMVCSDDLQAKELVTEGHIDHKLRVAIEAGLDPITAIQLATLNPAEYLGFAGSLGAIAPGKIADLLLVESLTDLRPSAVIAAGAVVARDGRMTGWRAPSTAGRAPSTSGRAPSTPAPDCLKATVELGGPVGIEDLRIAAPPGSASASVRVIGIDNGTLLSEALTSELPVLCGAVTGDPARDILKVAALDRHARSGRAGLAFVHGVGLRRGAVATTFTAPHYGLLVIGTTDEEMVAAVGAMAELGGGLIAVENGSTIAAVQFDLGGFVGSLALAAMHEQLLAFEGAAASLGSRLADPLISLASLTIPHIPAYGLSDLGLYDVEERRFVDVVLA